MLRWTTIGSQLNNPIKNPAYCHFTDFAFDYLLPAPELKNRQITIILISMDIYISCKRRKGICKISIFFHLKTSCRPLYSWNVRIFCQMFQTWSLKTFNAYLTQIYWISDIVLDTKTCNQDFSLMVFRMIALNIRSDSVQNFESHHSIQFLFH